MTHLISAANPIEMQKKLEAWNEDADRPWFLHGDVQRHDGIYYQFLRDTDPAQLTLRLDPHNIKQINQLMGDG